MKTLPIEMFSLNTKRKKEEKKAFARNQFGSEFISPLDFAVFTIMFSVLQYK